MGIKHWLSRMHFSISSASSTRWALKWIIKCKLPSVICHVVWGAQGVFSQRADATQHFPGKIFHVGHIFLRCCYHQMAKLERSPFQNHLCAHFDSLQCSGNERPECTEAAQVPANALPDPQLLPFGKKYFISHIYDEPIPYNNNMEQVQDAEAQLRNLFYRGNLLIFGGRDTFWKSLLIWCVYQFETGVSLIGKLVKVHDCNIWEKFRVLQLVWLWSLLHSIAIYLWHCSKAATGERQALQRSVWAWVTDSERWSALCFQTCWSAAKQMQARYWCLSSGLLQPIMKISSLNYENLCLSFMPLSFCH